jgi:hypothetical protein
VEQQILDFSRRLGDRMSRLATDKAERECSDFSARAEAAILAKLEQGRASGEDLTDYVRECGIPLARNGKELGSIYARLLKEEKIVRVGHCFRRRGNGTAGGSLYALAEAAQ